MIYTKVLLASVFLGSIVLWYFVGYTYDFSKSSRLSATYDTSAREFTPGVFPFYTALYSAFLMILTVYRLYLYRKSSMEYLTMIEKFKSMARRILDVMEDKNYIPHANDSNVLTTLTVYCGRYWLYLQSLTYVSGIDTYAANIPTSYDTMEGFDRMFDHIRYWLADRCFDKVQYNVIEKHLEFISDAAISLKSTHQTVVPYVLTYIYVGFAFVVNGTCPPFFWSWFGYIWGTIGLLVLTTMFTLVVDLSTTITTVFDVNCWAVDYYKGQTDSVIDSSAAARMYNIQRKLGDVKLKDHDSLKHKLHIDSKKVIQRREDETTY